MYVRRRLALRMRLEKTPASRRSPPHQAGVHVLGRSDAATRGAAEAQLDKRLIPLALRTVAPAPRWGQVHSSPQCSLRDLFSRGS